MKRVLMAAVLLGTWVGWAPAQFVDEDFAQRTDAQIREHRTVPVSFLVLDARGRIAEGAEVRLEQQLHAFDLGFVLHGDFPESYDPEAEGWRVFNAMSLARLTPWRSLQPSGPGDLATEALDAAIIEGRLAGFYLRWGPLVSADAYDLPEWVVPMRGPGLSVVSRSYLGWIAQRYRGAVGEIDLAHHTLGHDRISLAALRLLGTELRARWPGVRPALGFSDALSAPRSLEVFREADAVVKAQLGVERITLDEAFGSGRVDPRRLRSVLRRLADLGLEITVGSLEVGGADAVETAVNAETVLRALFAEPAVRGIYFSGLSGADLSDPAAALFDDAGQATGVAHAADRLFRKLYWSDETVTTDGLGRAEARVFLGDYRVTATLPDGGRVRVPLRLRSPGDGAGPIVLMPVADDWVVEDDLRVDGVEAVAGAEKNPRVP